MKKFKIAGAIACAAMLAIAPVVTPGFATAEVMPAAIAGSQPAAPITTEVPTWEEFVAQTYQDVDGVYVVDGDIPVSNLAELRDIYESMTGTGKAPGEKTNDTDLAANTTKSGTITLWSASQVGNLTYCVSDDFGAQKATVVAGMEAGGNMWEGASSSIDFKYLPAQDANCTTTNRNVVFTVVPVVGARYVARAFFPDAPQSQRRLLVNTSFETSGYAAENIMGHELGHVLGFRHEQTRPEAGTCFEDNNWVALTPYDSDSIMHYPQCNGTNEDLSFSPLDAVGAAEAYDSPVEIADARAAYGK